MLLLCASSFTGVLELFVDIVTIGLVHETDRGAANCAVEYSEAFPKLRNKLRHIYRLTESAGICFQPWQEVKFKSRLECRGLIQ